MTAEEETDFDLAMRYRTGLEKLYWLVTSNERCECEFLPNWDESMRNGVPHTSKELRKNDYICMYCRTEYIYAEAIGEALFQEQMQARITAFLDEHFEDPITIEVTDSEGVSHLQIIEKEDIDGFAEEHGLLQTGDYEFTEKPDDESE